MSTSSGAPFLYLPLGRPLVDLTISSLQNLVEPAILRPATGAMDGIPLLPAYPVPSVNNIHFHAND